MARTDSCFRCSPYLCRIPGVKRLGWVDTSSGEVSRARVSPAHRAGIRQFLSRFGRQELEVALEATTGWRFVVEELHAVGARVQLAEPAETSACAATRSAPRATAPTPGICGSC